MKKIMIILSFLLMTSALYSQNPATDHPAAIAAAVAANNGALTSAVVTALISGVGAAEEVNMFKAILAAYPGQALMIAQAALGCCSDSSAVGIVTAAGANTNISSTSYSSLYSSAVGNSNLTVATKNSIASLLGVNTNTGGGGGGGNTGGTGTLIPGTTGQTTKNNEGKSSP